ncbi:MAG: hypothetical protein HQL93_07930 [Magnetococcales bacterium]|nr:hypothetical protein [Magnetococcales bacterium]
MGSGIKPMALLSYMSVLCLVPMILRRDDAFVNFHARQGLVLWIWGVLAIFSLHIPIVGAFFFSASVMAIMLMSLAGLVSVLLAKTWPLPGVSMLAQKL